MNNLMDSLYIAWTIGTKDILDTIKNKAAIVNFILMILMVVFFYWLNLLRPFDQDVSVVVYDEGHTNLELNKVTLGDGAQYSFYEASSIQEMEQKMAFKNLGLVLPADFDQVLASGGTPTLSGYIFWADRFKIADLETKYSQAFSQILGQPVQVAIGQNVIIPGASASGNQSSVTHLMVYFIFWTGLALIPNLMLEEKQTRTIDALLTSPASPGQVVLGKALAGLFYILVIGGLAMALFSVYIVDWGLALSAFLGYALLATGLGLAVGSFIQSQRQLGLWTVVLILVMVIPATFYMEPMLKSGIRTILTWFPSSTLASLLRFSCSTGATPAQVYSNLAVSLASIGLAYGLVVWKVRRSDR